MVAAALHAYARRGAQTPQLAGGASAIRRRGSDARGPTLHVERDPRCGAAFFAGVFLAPGAVAARPVANCA